MGGSWETGQENKAVEAYLQWINNQVLPTNDSADKIAVLDQKIANEPRMFVKVQLMQQKHALTEPTATPEQLTNDFVKHAPGFTERNQISYATWREMGVPAAVLKQAGITGASGGGTRMAPDDPNRIRPYVPRRIWTEDEKAEFIAFYEAHGKEATAEHYGGKVNAIAQRYYGFRSDARKVAGEPPRSRGRPRANQAEA